MFDVKGTGFPFSTLMSVSDQYFIRIHRFSNMYRKTLLRYQKKSKDDKSYCGSGVRNSEACSGQLDTYKIVEMLPVLQLVHH